MHAATAQKSSKTIDPFKFEPSQGRQVKVRQQLLLLETLAISPATARTAVALLEEGTVLFQFQDYANPFPIFEVEVGSAEHQELVDGLQVHLASKHYKAGRLYSRRKNSGYSKAEKRVSALRAQFQATLTEDWLPVVRTEQGIAEATAKQMAFYAKVRQYETDIRRNRARRVDALHKASAKVSNIFELYKLLNIENRLN